VFVTGGGLGAFLLLLLAIVSVPQKKKPFRSNSYCGSYMCRKKERITMDLKNVIAKKQNKKTKTLTFLGLLIGSTHVVPPHRGYSAQAIWKKSLCPIHSGGFLSAMLTWFNLIIRPGKKGKRLVLHRCTTAYCITHIENVGTSKKKKKCAAT
jgi:hypothetical protein